MKSLLRGLIEPNNPMRARLAAAVPDGVLALIFLITWIAPFTFGQNTAMNLILVLVFEFVILHSSAIVVALLLGRFGDGSRALLIGLSLFYLLFAGGFSLVIGALWPLLTFAVLTVNRLTTMRKHDESAARARFQVIVVWAMTFGWYVAAMIVTSVIPMPRLGVSPDLVALLTTEAGGSMVEQPHHTLAFGFCYYLGVGLADGFDLFTKVTHRMVDRMEAGDGFAALFFSGIYRRLFERTAPPPSDRP